MLFRRGNVSPYFQLGPKFAVYFARKEFQGMVKQNSFIQQLQERRWECGKEISTPPPGLCPTSWDVWVAPK